MIPVSWLHFLRRQLLGLRRLLQVELNQFVERFAALHVPDLHCLTVGTETAVLVQKRVAVSPLSANLEVSRLLTGGGLGLDELLLISRMRLNQSDAGLQGILIELRPRPDLRSGGFWDRLLCLLLRWRPCRVLATCIGGDDTGTLLLLAYTLPLRLGCAKG